MDATSDPRLRVMRRDGEVARIEDPSGRAMSQSLRRRGTSGPLLRTERRLALDPKHTGAFETTSKDHSCLAPA
jgi:hypothetical protein